VNPADLEALEVGSTYRFVLLDGNVIEGRLTAVHQLRRCGRGECRVEMCAFVTVPPSEFVMTTRPGRFTLAASSLLRVETVA
jgi:hypothetical protein